MPKPKIKTLTDLPVQSFTNWDSVGIVQQALTDLDGGIFRSPSLLSDTMLRDDRIFGVSETRINALLGLQIEFKPADESSKAQKAADALEEDWPVMFPEPALSEYLRWGHFLSLALGELQWNQDGKRWRFALKVWNPQNLWWDWSKRIYKLTTLEELVELEEPTYGKGDGQFMLYTPHGAQRGWIYGLVRTLAVPWLMRQWTYRDWARYSEVYGMPIRKVVMPMEIGEAHKERALREMAAMGTESVFRAERASDDNKWDLELVEAKSTGYATFKDLIEQVNESIAICILGQNLTTQVNEGSRAAAQVHDKVRADFLRADAKTLSATIREQALKYWANFNFGNPDLAPKVVWKTDPPDDKESKANTFMTVSTALQSMRTSQVRIDLEKVAEDFGLPIKPSPDYVAAPGALPGQPSLTGIPGRPMPGAATPNDAARPGGRPHYWGKNAKYNQPSKPNGTPPPKNGKPTKTTLQVAAAEDGNWLEGGDRQNHPKKSKHNWLKPENDAGGNWLEVVDDKTDLSLLAQISQLPEAARAGQLYADALVDSHVQAAREALAPDIRAILAVVNSADSFEELRRGLIQTFGERNPKKLEALFRKALVLANLNGRHSVLGEL